ncbi:hypothetical protein [Nannocystis exedens]|nr:hypothetical protein [Nannocystis exedens]
MPADSSAGQMAPGGRDYRLLVMAHPRPADAARKDCHASQE